MKHRITSSNIRQDSNSVQYKSQYPEADSSRKLSGSARAVRSGRGFHSLADVLGLY